MGRWSAPGRVAAVDVCTLSAVDTVGLLHRREVHPRELVEAALRRIEHVDPALNALPTLCPERALAHADRASADSLLAGLPLAVKDLVDVAGVRTTYGSPIFSDSVPETSDILVERLEQHD